MLPPAEPAKRAAMHALTALGATAAVVGMAWAGPACAQQADPAVDVGTVYDPAGEQPGTPPPLPDDTFPPPTGFNAAGEREIAFDADIVDYDSKTEIITARGNVVLRNADRSVRADTVSWNRKTGQIVAEGRVRFVDENGNQLYSDSLELTDKFEAGQMQNLLLALRQGGRMAANSGERDANGSVTLNEAVYSACPVETPAGCPRDPTWRITANRVNYNPDTARITFTGAHFEVFGLRLVPLPGLTISTNGGSVSGLLVPDVKLSKSNGVEISSSYYMRLTDNKDLTLGGTVYSEASPMAYGQWRQLFDKGAYQITGYATAGERKRGSDEFTQDSDKGFRGYIFANGRFQFSPKWSLTSSIRRATDRTFLRRHDISRDDRLRSMIELARVDDNSYLSVAGWATQTMRLNEDQGQVPIALPVIDYRRLMPNSLLGGTTEIELNTLAINRTDGQDTQRAFALGRWDLKRVTGMGQVVTLTGLVRGDLYHSSKNELTSTVIYRGNPGWETRGVALAAVDMQWPFVGRLFGGEQVLTPRVQLVAAPTLKNLSIPNEDSRALDLEDSNLFALNRFAGYDRVEDGTRVTYGFDWQLRRPGWEVRSTLGQSYRLNSDTVILPDGTGLSQRLSDFVGRTEVRFKDFVKFTYRYRLDKDTLAVRRNEVDATVGSSRTYGEISYLQLKRNIVSVEDLQDREELRAAGRVAFANYWSVFGSGVFNLTNRSEDPTLNSDGFNPIRMRLGVAYQDDCLEMGVTWRRDYETSGDARRGNTFLFYFRLRNLGYR